MLNMAVSDYGQVEKLWLKSADFITLWSLVTK